MPETKQEVSAFLDTGTSFTAKPSESALGSLVFSCCLIKRLWAFLFAPALFLCLALACLPARAAEYAPLPVLPDTSKRLAISTVENRSLAIDSLSYIAFSEIGWETVIVDSLSQGNSTVAFVLLGISVIAGLSMLLYKFRNQNAELLEVRKHLHTAAEMLEKDAKIKDAKERLESIINTAPVLYLLLIRGRVIEMNERAKRMDIVCIGDETKHIYEDPNVYESISSRIYKDGFITGEVIRVFEKSGTIRRLLINAVTVEYEEEHAVAVWAIDIEQDELKKDQLSAARQSLQTILDTLPIPVRISDMRNDTILYANNSCAELFRYSSPEKMYGMPVIDTMPKAQSDGLPSIQLVKKVHCSACPAPVEVEYMTADGKIIEAEVLNCTLNYLGTDASIGIIRDLAVEKEYEKMLLNAAEREKEANQIKSRFLVNMSHEIRTPMNAVIGLTEIELRKKPPKETRDVYKKINTSAKDLLQIINDILDLSKIEADKMELYNQEFELEEVISSAMLVATPRLDGKNVEMVLKASMDLPRRIIGDRTRLWQILKNFLDNSAKYTEAGKIVLIVSLVEEKTDNVTIRFQIEDTGIGMDNKQLEDVFQPYEQFYSDAQRRYSGTGLGMPISKHMCELMGGHMEISSALGEGTKVAAIIPFGRSENGETQLQAIETPGLKELKALIVDDDDTSLEIMSGLLKCSGVNCVLAHSGKEALQTIFEYREVNEFFDIILLDYMMEGLSGLETARQIHIGLSKAPKLIMVTAYQKQLLKKELEANGIDEIIEKPFVPSQFIQKLCETLGIGSKEEADVTDVSFSVFEDANVLIVEDNALNQEVAAGMCKYFGITSVCADNGQRALEILNETGSFDLIFMDLKMPILDGYETTRAIRADGRWNDIPIVSLTADAMVEVVNNCKEAGMNDHITKPIEIEKLYEVLVKWLPKEKHDTKGEAKIKRLSHLSDEKSRAREEALIRFQGDEKLFKKALLEFALQDLPEDWADFDEAVENKEETLKFVHNLKGVAGNISEMDVYYGASRFESSLRKGTPSEEMYSFLVAASAEAKERIIAEAEEGGQYYGDAGTSSEFAEILAELEEALINYDPVACSEMAEKLKAKKWPFTDDIKIKQLLEFSEAYEFDEGFRALKQLRDGSL